MHIAEAVSPPPDNFAEAATHGYEYRRQDGTVEHAPNREAAIRLCPVLGEMAMNDPEAANLLLDMASIGQDMMAEKAERAEPEKDHHTGPKPGLTNQPNRLSTRFCQKKKLKASPKQQQVQTKFTCLKCINRATNRSSKRPRA